MRKLFEVVGEDEELLVINKPAGLACHPTKGDEYSSLISRVRLYLGPDATPHLINRLDRETSGLVMVGRQLEAAVHLRKLWESREVEKEYLAIVRGRFPGGRTVIRAPLGKDPNSAVAIKDAVVPDGAEAETHAFLVRHVTHPSGDLSLVRVLLRTGRKHQIRIHLSHVGHPIVGDKLYGGDENLYLDFVKGTLTPEQHAELVTENQALHANRLTFSWFGARRTFTCPPEAWFAALAGQ
jgi:RluA family pseudouridine synthase